MEKKRTGECRATNEEEERENTSHKLGGVANFVLGTIARAVGGERRRVEHRGRREVLVQVGVWDRVRGHRLPHHVVMVLLRLVHPRTDSHSVRVERLQESSQKSGIAQSAPEQEVQADR